MDDQSGPEPLVLNNVYFNGFQLGLSNADVSAVLVLNGTPQVGLSMSYTTAKSLANSLNELVNTLELATGRSIMTTKEVGSGLEKIKEETEIVSTH